MEIHKKSNSQSIEDRKEAAQLLESQFSSLSEEYRDQAWQDLIMLTGDQDRDVRVRAADALGSAFSHLPEEHRDQAWQDLIMLIGLGYSIKPP